MDESRPKKNCIACDHQELEAIKGCLPILCLEDEIEKLKIRLKECRHENNHLRDDLHVAKKLIHKAPANLYTIRNVGPETGWKEKTDTVMKLRQQIRECQEELAQLEEAKAASAYVEESTRRLSYVEKRPFWKVELERRQSKGDGVVADPVTKQSNELRAKLEAQKSRFKTLNREVKLVQNELQKRKDSNKDEFGLKKSYETMEEQLLEIQTEISKIRLNWAEVKSRNQNLGKEISEYRNKVKAIQEDSKANNVLINDLTERHRATQKVIDSRKCFVQQMVSRYDEDLEGDDSVFVELGDIYEKIQNITDEKISLVRDLETLVAEGLSGEKDETLTPEANKSILEPEGEAQKESENIDGLSKGKEESADTEANPEMNPKLEKLLVQCEKYRTLTEAVKAETDRWVYIASLQEEHLNEIAKQVVETKRLVFEKTEYLNKEKRMQAANFPKGKQTETSNIRIKVKALRDENEYLRAFLKNVVENKVNDTKICTSFMNESKVFFDDALVRFKDVAKVWKSKKSKEPKVEQNETPED